MDFNQRATFSPDVISQEVGGETVLLDLASESYFGLDKIGTRIWQLIGEGHNLNSIVQTLMAEYDVSETALRADIEALILDSQQRGLINLENTP